MEHTNINKISNINLEIISFLLKEIEWDSIKTRTSKRKVSNFDPDKHDFLIPVVEILMNEAKRITNKEVISLQVFLNYYPTGDDSCPTHEHGCRQIVLSIGDWRIMKVNSKEITVENGSIVYLYGQNHSIKKSDKNNERFSIVLFFSSPDDENVSIYA